MVLKMEKEKRKRAVDDGGKHGKRGKAREDDGTKTTSETGNDEEVEEFYAILRRIKVAVKYFEKGSDGRKSTAAKGSSLWSPAFEWEDFKKAPADVGSVKSGKEGVEDNVGLDLNAEPDPESDPDYS